MLSINRLLWESCFTTVSCRLGCLNCRSSKLPSLSKLQSDFVCGDCGVKLHWPSLKCSAWNVFYGDLNFAQFNS